MTRLRVVLAAGAAIACAACGAETPGLRALPVRYELGAYLPVAEIEGEAEQVADPGAAPRVGLRLAAGSRALFHFELPEAPVLVGEGDGDPRAADVRTRVAVRAAGEAPPRVVQAASFRERLPGLAREMVRVEVACAGDAARDAPCEWRSLRIEGTRAQALPAEIARDRYNVFVILLDSLRQDHLAPYGATDVKTPNLAMLSEEGVTFDNARSNASWTRSSVAAMLTALPPPAHGVQTLDDTLAEGLPYLPEILSAAGYRTVAVSNNPHVSSGFGFERGFDQMIELWNLDPVSAGIPSDPEGRAKFVWSRYIRPTVRGEEPFFVYLHEIDPHSPYDPPEPYRSEYGFDYRGGIESTQRGLWAMRKFPDRVTPEDVRHINGRYRGEVAFMDRYVGWILRRLAGVTLEHPTLVVFTSDHGEEFWEHGSVGHGHAVHEELLRVPLLLKLDGVLPAGRRVRADVTLADLAPTVLDLVGLAIPPTMEGESLLPLVTAPDDLRLRRSAVARGNEAPAQESISIGRWKLVRNAGGRDGALALFDLERDPGEQRDITAERPIVAATLAQRLRWNDRRPARAPAEPRVKDPKLERRLQALGYAE